MSAKTVLITGAASGIGRATALAFAGQGARISLADINNTGGHDTLAMIRQKGGEAIFIPTDVSRAADVAAMVEETVTTFGRLDYAFNNAGIVGTPSTTVECTEDNWNQVLGVDLKRISKRQPRFKTYHQEVCGIR